MTEVKELTKDTLDTCEKLMEKHQFQYVKYLAETSEEKEFFIDKMNELVEIRKKLITEGRARAKSNAHPAGLRYFHPTGTEIYVTELEEDGYGFGYSILRGDFEMAEWGYLSLDDITSVPAMEIDLYFDTNQTVEEYLADRYPEYYKK